MAERKTSYKKTDKIQENQEYSRLSTAKEKSSRKEVKNVVKRSTLIWQRNKSELTQPYHYLEVRTLVDNFCVRKLYCLLENSTMLRLVQNPASSLNSHKDEADSLPKC